MGRWPRQRRGGASLEELEALYRGRYRVFLRVAAGVVGDTELARDAVQEGFLRAVRRRSSFRGEGTLESWVWRAVLTAAADAARSPARRRETPGAASGDLPGAAHPSPNGWASSPADASVRALIAVLPLRQRQALFLHYYADLDYAAIAEALGVAPGTVAASLHTARQSLRRMLEVTDDAPA